MIGFICPPGAFASSEEWGKHLLSLWSIGRQDDPQMGSAIYEAEVGLRRALERERR